MKQTLYQAGQDLISCLMRLMVVLSPVSAVTILIAYYGILNNTHRFVIAHVLEAPVVHLQDHITGFDPTVQRHGAALHDGSHVDSAVSSVSEFVALKVGRAL